MKIDPVGQIVADNLTAAWLKHRNSYIKREKQSKIDAARHLLPEALADVALSTVFAGGNPQIASRRSLAADNRQLRTLEHPLGHFITHCAGTDPGQRSSNVGLQPPVGLWPNRWTRPDSACGNCAAANGGHPRPLLKSIVSHVIGYI